MKEEIRERIRLENVQDAKKFVKFINNPKDEDEYILQDKTGGRVADAYTIIWVAYAVSEFNNYIYLVNKTHNGVFPEGINQFRYTAAESLV